MPRNCGGQPKPLRQNLKTDRRCSPTATLRQPSSHQRQHVAHRKVTDWTTLLERVGIRRDRNAPATPRETRIFPTQQSTSHVPAEYRALYMYLNHRYASVVVLTFEQIEALSGFPLPESARTECAWWTDIVDARGHSAAWTEAGRTAVPNMLARTITFERPPDA